jgi:pimeloyl-ACP methyl ester carboxylesterase
MKVGKLSLHAASVLGNVDLIEALAYVETLGSSAQYSYVTGETSMAETVNQNRRRIARCDSHDHRCNASPLLHSRRRSRPRHEQLVHSAEATLRIDKAILAGFDWGARTANIVAALWPERCNAMVSVSGYLIGSQEAGKLPLPPKAEYEWWYQYYFATERGRIGYDKNRHDFAKLIWQLASPQWKFDDATFDRSAASFDNPDHVAIVIHNYRWRLALAQGEPKYEDLERRLAQGPVITVPTITLEGDANGAPHADPSAYAKKFSGKYAHRTITGGIGHNLPQEAPQAFAQAVIDVDRF